MDVVDDREHELLERIRGLEVERARVEAQTAQAMLDFADHRRRIAELEPNPRIRALETSAAADELALALRQPTRTVQIRLSQARFLRSCMPATWLAHQSGRLDAYRVMLIADQAHMLTRDESRMALDQKAPAYAETHTGAQTKAWLRRFIARVEPESASRRHRRAHADRSVWIQHDADGISWLHAQLSTADAARIDRTLAHAGKGRCANHPGLTLQQARSDVLADVLLGRADHGATNRDSATRPGAVIGVTVPITTLVGLNDQPGVSFDGEFVLPADVVRELAAEPGTFFYRILTDPLGHILDVAEMGRFPSNKLRVAVQARDGTCVFPTCSRPAWACDLDHEVPHPRGPTSGANLQPLCRWHHGLKGNGLLPDRGASQGQDRLAHLLVDTMHAA